jgi:hypothetical protein
VKVAYCAGPYRASTVRGIVENIRAAEAVALELWRLGFAVLCPHTNSSLFDGALPDSVWLQGDLVMLGRCDLVVLCPGWEQSTGASAERERAELLEIDVYQWPADAELLAKVAKATPEPEGA